MKDQVQSCHLTKFDAFGVNRDEVIDLETWFKIHANVCNLETASPKTNLYVCIYVCMYFVKLLNLFWLYFGKLISAA